MSVSLILSALAGSSPLTRGKPGQATDPRDRGGLIPAHAGKTPWRPVVPSLTRAHPRSRGENNDPASAPLSLGGSSPLTRGKPLLDPIEEAGRRLIPAHAGKTVGGVKFEWAHKAHPRSRGENHHDLTVASLIAGSSPLTRGKRVASPQHPPRHGLIPAHAGKTLPDLRFYCADRSDLGNP